MTSDVSTDLDMPIDNLCDHMGPMTTPLLASLELVGGRQFFEGFTH